jgi:hypothetical protein
MGKKTKKYLWWGFFVFVRERLEIGVLEDVIVCSK